MSQSVAFFFYPIQFSPAGLAYLLLCASVDRPLEEEFDVALLSGEPGATEGTGRVEGVGSVGQRDLAPAHYSLFGAHMATGAEGVGGRAVVQVQAAFTAQPQRDVGAHPPAHGALPLPRAGRSRAAWTCSSDNKLLEKVNHSDALSQ